MLIRDATLVPMDGSDEAPLGDVRQTSLRIDGARIAEIGELTPRPDEPVLDAAGMVMLPGFVQGHVHLCQTLFRGLADDLPLMDWLRQRIWPLEAAHDEASTRASAELSLLDLWRGGTTAVQLIEGVRHTEASLDVVAASGMVAILGNCLMDLATSGEPTDLPTTAAEAMRLCEELHVATKRHPNVHYAVAPRFVLSCSEGLARDAAAYAEQHALRVHTHACEHPGEVEEVKRRLGRGAISALHDLGLVGPRTGLAHCVHTDDEERRLLAKSDAAVLHCPSTNLKLGSGIAPVAEYERMGLRIALGADGAPCNNRLSALTELRQAALLQAMRSGPGVWPAARALWTATRGGARALGLDADLGSLEPGKRADLVLFDLRELAPSGDLASQIVYAADERHIRDVFIGGNAVVRDGEHVVLDADRVRARAIDMRAAAEQRAGLRC